MIYFPVIFYTTGQTALCSFLLRTEPQIHSPACAMDGVTIGPAGRITSKLSGLAGEKVALIGLREVLMTSERQVSFFELFGNHFPAARHLLLVYRGDAALVERHIRQGA